MVRIKYRLLTLLALFLCGLTVALPSASFAQEKNTPPWDSESEAWWNGRPFDRVLADVSCSASGVVRRHPDIKWLQRAADLGRFVGEQSRLLEAQWQVLAPGGKLRYATCSVFPEENDAVLTDFVARRGDARRLHLPGLAGGQLLPDDDRDGFFYAFLEKTQLEP